MKEKKETIQYKEKGEIGKKICSRSFTGAGAVFK
jgi:hypothetical protein